MYISRRKKSDDLFQHPFDETESRIASDAEDTIVDVPRLAHLVLLPGAAQPRVGGQRGHGVSRKLDLGNDRDEAAGGVFDHIADLVLRVEPSVRRLVIAAGLVVLAARVLADQRAGAHRTDARKFGIFHDLDPPALVIGQMPVENIHLVQGEQVQHTLHLLHRKEMPRDIEHHPAVAHPRTVLDDHGRQFDSLHPFRPECRRGQQLAQGLHGIESPLGTSGKHLDPVGRDRQGVAVRGDRIGPDEIHRPVLCRGRRAHGQPPAENRTQHVVQRIGHERHPLVRRPDDHARRCRQSENPFGGRHAHRRRHHGDRAVHRNHTAAPAAQHAQNKQYP